MPDYMIEQVSQEFAQPVEPAIYLIKYTKEVETVDGQKVVVVDENRTEQITIDQLEAQKASLQTQIKAIDLKLAEIAKL